MSGKRRIFISSVQKEFAAERRTLKEFILGDALLGRFFDVFLFEDLPATGRRADEVYLEAPRTESGLGEPTISIVWSPSGCGVIWSGACSTLAMTSP